MVCGFPSSNTVNALLSRLVTMRCLSSTTVACSRTYVLRRYVDEVLLHATVAACRQRRWHAAELHLRPCEERKFRSHQEVAAGRLLREVEKRDLIEMAEAATEPAAH